MVVEDFTGHTVVAHSEGSGDENGAIVPVFVVVLNTLGKPKWERLEYEAEMRPKQGEAIFVDGRWAFVDDVIPTESGTHLLECQRLYRLRLIDMDAQSVEPGEILTDQPRYREHETLLIDSTGERLRVLRMDDEWPDDFDGALVVEPFPG